MTGSIATFQQVCFGVEHIHIDSSLETVFQDFRQRCMAIGLPDPAPFLISTFRTWEHQKELQERWDMGDRTGLAARPADPNESRHVQGTAFDLGAADELLHRYGRVWISMGYRWGGVWIPPDRNHFDMG